MSLYGKMGLVTETLSFARMWCRGYYLYTLSVFITVADGIYGLLQNAPKCNSFKYSLLNVLIESYTDMIQHVGVTVLFPSIFIMFLEVNIWGFNNKIICFLYSAIRCVNHYKSVYFLVHSGDRSDTGMSFFQGFYFI